MNSKVIEEAFENRKKLSKEVKNDIIKSIIFNIVMIVVMMVITVVINILFAKLSTADFDNYVTIVQIVVALMVIALYEVAYKKDSLKLGLYGIEFSLFSIAVLYVPYMYLLNNNTDLLKLTILVFSVYYVAKSIVTYFIERHNYLKDNMSDVKEIVKDDKKGYIDEESKKTLKERKQKEENSKVKKNSSNKKTTKNSSKTNNKK